MRTVREPEGAEEKENGRDASYQFNEIKIGGGGQGVARDVALKERQPDLKKKKRLDFRFLKILLSGRV